MEKRPSSERPLSAKVRSALNFVAEYPVGKHERAKLLEWPAPPDVDPVGAVRPTQFCWACRVRPAVQVNGVVTPSALCFLCCAAHVAGEGRR